MTWPTGIEDAWRVNDAQRRFLNRLEELDGHLGRGRLKQAERSLQALRQMTASQRDAPAKAQKFAMLTAQAGRVAPASGAAGGSASRRTEARRQADERRM